MNQSYIETIIIAGQQRVPAVTISAKASIDDLREGLVALGLSHTQGAVTLVGGAATFDTDASPQESATAQRTLRALATVARTRRLVVIDGGTDTGVMRMMGEARQAQGSGFPLIGVAPRGKVTWGGRSVDDQPVGNTRLEANHSAFVLIDAEEWGAESAVLAKAAYALVDRPVEFVINGGAVTAEHDVRLFVEEGGIVVAVAGTGRFADQLAAAANSGAAESDIIKPLLASGRVRVLTTDVISQAAQPGQALWTWLEANTRA